MSARARHRFRLYVAGRSPNSALAIANLEALCRAHLPNQHEIEVVDVFREPQRAVEDGVLLTPTLIRLTPRPECRVVGNLQTEEKVLHALGLRSR